jgi:hypothetical protein
MIRSRIGRVETRAVLGAFRLTRVTERGISVCIASGAVNGAVFFGIAREQMGLDVMNVTRTTSSAVLHGIGREQGRAHIAGS